MEHYAAEYAYLDPTNILTFTTPTGRATFEDIELLSDIEEQLKSKGIKHNDGPATKVMLKILLLRLRKGGQWKSTGNICPFSIFFYLTIWYRFRGMRFPETLEALETYVGMANWLRKNVRYFAQISEPLQRLKTELLKRSPAIGGRVRKNYSRATKVDPTEKEMESFEVLQKALTTETYLHHFNPNRQLYIDLDRSKRYGFGAMIYHVKKEPLENAFPSTDIV